jgi:hypothetical protein
MLGSVDGTKQGAMTRHQPSTPTYGVFVWLRARRLTLKRGFSTQKEALAFATEVRKLRFHAPEKVVVLREPDGAPVPDPEPIPSSVAERVATYAKALASALHDLGPTPREKARNMLMALDLSADDADAVLAYALTLGLLAVDPHDPDRLRVESGEASPTTA